MDRSWLSKATTSRYGLLPESNHELPRWRSPSPLAASVIPPPIVQSAYISSPKATARSTIPQQQPYSDDRQGELEADLQFLLDAQAEGLAKGVEGGLQDEQSSTGSTTPTARSIRSASARRTRPVRKKPGLRSARKGIYNSILALSAIKNEELQSIDAEVKEKDGTLAQIDEWEQKRQGLEGATRDVHDSEETVRAQRLRQEADVLQRDINAVEMQLQDMKARHSKLLRHAAAAENAVQAKLASYTSSLSMLEVDVQRFLFLKPTDGDASRPTSSTGKASVWQMPAKRRTLELAREQCAEDKDVVLQQRQAIDQEKAALDEGAATWKDVVGKVTEFEKRLRASMSDLSSSQSAWDDEPPQQQDNFERVKELLQHLDAVLGHLETQHDIAEQRDWNLLIAAIGAELHALRQGREVLQSVLGITSDQFTDQGGDLVDTAEASLSANDSSPADGEAGNEIHQLDKSFETARPPRRRASDSEDDPDPELLFSRQDVEHD